MIAGFSSGHRGREEDPKDLKLMWSLMSIRLELMHVRHDRSLHGALSASERHYNPSALVRFASSSVSRMGGGEIPRIR